MAKAEPHAATLMPGFTHLQPAQPVTFGHHLMAYVEMLGRDASRFADARARMNESPLGAAALAGSPFPIDRDQTAKALGFDAPAANSLDAVADRDFALEALSGSGVARSGAVATAPRTRRPRGVILAAGLVVALGVGFAAGHFLAPSARPLATFEARTFDAEGKRAWLALAGWTPARATWTPAVRRRPSVTDACGSSGSRPPPLHSRRCMPIKAGWSIATSPRAT